MEPRDHLGQCCCILCTHLRLQLDNWGTIPGKSDHGYAGSDFLVSIFSQRERERGKWAVYYTSPQSLIITFLIRWLNNFKTVVNFDWLDD